MCKCKAFRSSGDQISGLQLALATVYGPRAVCDSVAAVPIAVKACGISDSGLCSWVARRAVVSLPLRSGQRSRSRTAGRVAAAIRTPHALCIVDTILVAYGTLFG
jgi:hypothetical protein